MQLASAWERNREQRAAVLAGIFRREDDFDTRMAQSSAEPAVFEQELLRFKTKTKAFETESCCPLSSLSKPTRTTTLPEKVLCEDLLLKPLISSNALYSAGGKTALNLQSSRWRLRNTPLASFVVQRARPSRT